MPRPSPSDELSARWSALHHGIDPAGVPMLRGWLRLIWGGARVLARARVPPTVVTLTGVVLAAAAVAAAGRLPLPGALLVLCAALCDGLDGAVAVVADRATRSGAYADAVADRLCDIAFALVLWRSGAPWVLAAVAAVVAVGVDALRRVRRVPAKITVAERPTFAVCALLACLSSAVSRPVWPVLACAAVWLAAGCVATVQLLRTRPSGTPPPG